MARKRRGLSKAAIRRFWPLPFAVPLVLGFCAWRMMSPAIVPGYVNVNGQARDFSIPMSINEKGTIDLEYRFTLPLIHPVRYYVLGDDCVNDVKINAQTLDMHPVACGVLQGKIIDLSQMLRAGENVVTASIRNDGGNSAFFLRPSYLDPVAGGMLLLVALAVLWAWLVAANIRGKNPIDTATLCVIIALCSLRFAYAMHTPYLARNHDTDGHTEYIQYIAKNFTLPAAKTGWEYWQPPLYYLTSAAIYGPATALGLAPPRAFFAVQMQSIAFGVLTVLLAYTVARMTLKDLADRRDFLLGIGTLPGILYFTTRVNNDVMASVLSFFAFALLVRWWKKGGWEWWYGAMIAIAFAVLSKYNGLLLLPVALVLLLLKTHIHWKNRLLHATAGLLMIATVLSLSMARSQATTPEEHLVGNIASMGNDLRLPNTAKALLTFNPAQIVLHPYNNPWSDAERRANFPEFFFRSAFAGEWGLGEKLKLPLQWILILALLLLSVAITGIVASLTRWRAHLPFFAALVILGLGHMAFRVVSPFSSSQDFRYSPLLAVPVFYFLIQGCIALPKTPRIIAVTILRCSAVLWVLFVSSL